MALVVTSAPFQQVNMPALDLRRTLGVGRTEGIVGGGDMAVAQRAAGANLSVDIAAGEAFVQGDSITNQGLYYAYNDAVYNLTGFTAAHATLPRVDRIALRVRDAFHGDAANDEAFVVLTGTATTGATLANLTGAPGVPGGHFLLANVLIPATATSVTTANIDTTVRVRTVPSLGALYDTILGATATSIDVTGIPASYAHLLVSLYGRGDTAATDVGVTIRFNNDAGTNYAWQQITAVSTTITGASAASASSGFVANLPAGTATAGAAGGATIWIPGYSTTAMYKVAYSVNMDAINPTSAALNTIYVRGVAWAATGAINRITLLPSAGNFVTGTRLTIYAMGA